MRSFLKSILVPAVALAATGLLMLGCPDTGGGSSGDPPRCVPGTSQACTCEGGEMGSQVCTPSGTFSPCVCTPGTGGAGGTGGSTSASGGNAGAGGAMNCHPANQPMCGDGATDANEECDDGNCDPTDNCNNNCKLPFCGDGIVNGNETCDGGEFCDATCKPLPDMGPPDMGDPCQGKIQFAGFLSMPSKGQITDGVEIGLKAADLMCQTQLGANVMCDYDQWKELEMYPADHPLDTGKLVAAIPANQCRTIWLHRTTDVGANCPAGAGARCNDWKYPTGHVANGEWVKVCNTGAMFTYEYKLDCDPIFDGTGAHVQPGMSCGVMYDVPCCFTKCIPKH